MASSNQFRYNPGTNESCHVELPARRLPSVAEAVAQLERCREELRRLQAAGAPHGPVRTAECAVFGAEETHELARCQETGELTRVVDAYRQAEVQVLRIGDCCLAGLPGELFVEYGLQLKARFPKRAFVASLVNGELQGYIVTPEAAAAGGYEAANALFAPGAGPLLIDAALGLIRQLSMPR
jgi:neutral ceramidase